jgi:hypothetical protein
MDALAPNLAGFPADSTSIGLGTSPQVWLFSDFEGYNQLRSVGYPLYLSTVQQARLERLRQARLLHDGKHWRLFLFEQRTQFDFPEARVLGKIKRPYVPFNLLKLIAQKSSDLLFGEEPAIRVDQDLQQKDVAELVQRTHLHDLLYGGSKECAYDGEYYFEAVVQSTLEEPTGAVYLQRVDAADIFPVGQIQANGQYRSYVRYNARNTNARDPKKKPDWKLLVTTYEAGAIRRDLYQLDEKGYQNPKVLTLNQWPQEDPSEEPLEEITETYLDRPTIVFVPNLLVRGFPVSDFDGLVELQDCLNAKMTQLARIFALHSMPKIAMPQQSADASGNARSDADVHFFNTPDEIPKYITWDAQIEAAIKDRDNVRDALLIEAEMSPILLGIQTGATSKANAFKSIRLEAINSLTKAQRKAVIWRAAIDRLLSLALDMQGRIPTAAKYDRQPLAIEMKDGLPVDTDSKASEIATYRGAGVMSVKRAVELQIPDPERAAEELEDIAAENAQQTPSVFLTNPADAADPAAEQQEAHEQEKSPDVPVAA